jgi:large subunit ribosomal protein L18
MARNPSRIKRHNRVRAVVKGTAKRPRINVFRSLSNFYVQLIDDERGHTLASVSSKDVGNKGKKSEAAALVGKKVAEKALSLGITEAVFDRGGYQYHGRVKECADAARAAGLKF